jgi:hypothetical protein
MLDAILESAAAKKAMDIFGDKVLGKWKRRREAHEALELSRNRILSVRIANNYYPELTRLREIFIRHGLSNSNDDNCRFFETWLSHPAVEMGWAPSGGWTAAKIEALRVDLAKIRA